MSIDSPYTMTMVDPDDHHAVISHSQPWSVATSPGVALTPVMLGDGEDPW